MSEQHATTLALVDAMKARGVRSFVVGDVKVEFGPAEASLKSEPGAAVDTTHCACGCPLAGHMGGMCVTAGCSPERCSEKK